MANRHKSALKAARQAVRRTERNKAGLAKFRTAVKKIRAAIAKPGTKEEAKKVLYPMLTEVQSVLMKAAKVGLIEKGTASRQVARLSSAIYKVAGAR